MSNVPTPRKHKRKTPEPTHVAHTFTPSIIINKHTHVPTDSPTAHVRVHTETPTDSPTAHVRVHVEEDTDPPIPVQTQLLYSSSSSDSKSLNPGVYVGAMFMLPMVVLGAWFVQGRVRRRHYHPIPNDDDFP